MKTVRRFSSKENAQKCVKIARREGKHASIKEVRMVRQTSPGEWVFSGYKYDVTITD